MPDGKEPPDISVLDAIRPLKRKGKDPLGRHENLLVEHSGQLVVNMEKALTRGDVRTASELACSLKSSRGNVNALNLLAL